MSYLIQRLLIVASLCALLFWLSIDRVHAGVDYDGSSGSAFAHCEVAGQIYENGKNASYGGTYSCAAGNGACFVECVAGGNVNGPQGVFPSWKATCTPYPGGSVGSCEGYGGAVDYHTYDPVIEDECTAWDAGDQSISWYDSDLGPPLTVCDSNCQFDLTGDTGYCEWDDSLPNGVRDPGETMWCEGSYTANGDYCLGTGGSGGGPIASDHPAWNNEMNCQNVDCSEDAAPGPGGIGGNEGGDLPGQNTPPPAPGGDGDSSTPDPGDGTGNAPPTSGSGAASDGSDCNPLANPDCSYAGSGTGSGDCDVQPSCTGDPVQCAILYQNWAVMCYDGASITGTDVCTTDMTCEGDVLLCEAIRMQKNQFCEAYVGDGSIDTDVFNDLDFDRDLKDEAEVIEIPSALDQSGFAGGGSCPAPVAIGVMGTSIDLSLQIVCDLAAYIRIMVIIAALITGFLIVTADRRVKA